MLLLILMAMTNNSDTPALQVFKFNQLQDNQHMIVNDSVMGGRSDSEMAMQNDAALYTGKVSLENNGGFASVRMIWPFELADTKDQPTIVRLNVKGDGKSYQLRLRTNRGFDGAAYSYSFDTIKDQKQTFYIPIDQFIPTFRGRVLRDMPKLKFSDVRQMGVLIADYQTGDFAIELHDITLQ